MVYHSGHLYLFGGRDLNLTNDDRLYRYDMVAKTWVGITTENTPTLRTLFGVTVYDGYMYVLPGWDENAETDIMDIKRISLASTTLTKYTWETVDVDLEAASLAMFPRDSYAYASNNTLVYFACGYTESGLSNDIIELDLSKKPLTFKRLSVSSQSPSARKNHSAHIIGNKAYLFGGDGGEDGKFNDMWTFNIETEIWSQEKLIGDLPTPRSGYASCSVGDRIYYFGGEGDSQLYRDFYIFDTQSNSFTELDDIDWPTARKNACMLCNFPVFGIFGGVTVNGYQNDMYYINTRDNTINQISNNDPQGPEPRSHMKCFSSPRIEGGKTKMEYQVVLGESFGETPQDSVFNFNPATSTWNKIADIDGKSQAAVIKIDDRLLIAGGERWGLEWENYVSMLDIACESCGEVKLGELTRPIYNGAYFYVKSTLFMHGGGNSIGKKFRPLVPSSKFMRLEMNENCESTGCDWSCSPGTYYINGICVLCEEGSYNEQYGQPTCKKCPAGTASNSRGNSSSRQCYPCTEGYYSASEGSRLCYACPYGYNCFIGATTPTLRFNKASEILSEQPENYTTDISKAADINRQIQIAIGLLGFVFIVTYLVLDDKRRYLAHLDLYTKQHNHFVDEVMFVRAKPIGGLFSLLFLLVAVMLILISLVIFSIANIEESKALVPLVTLEKDFEEFIGEVKVTLKFESYKGACGDEDEGKCPSEILIDSQYIVGSISTSCSKADDVCTLLWKCDSCQITTGARINYEMQDIDGFSDRIVANVTSFSSIPGEYSSIDQSIASTYNSVFRGPDESEFYFEMTPSVSPRQAFTSDTSEWETDLTGYHVAATQSFEAGSVTLVSE